MSSQARDVVRKIKKATQKRFSAEEKIFEIATLYPEWPSRQVSLYITGSLMQLI